MIELKVRAKDIDDLIAFWGMLGKQISEGYLSGDMFEGWDITDLEQV